MRRTLYADKTAGWLIAALTAVILAFFGATTFAQLRADAIHDLATEMATVAAPSIEQLAQARGDLRRIEALVTLYMSDEANEGPQAVSIHEIERMRTLYQHRITEYLALPAFPGEDIYRKQIEVDTAEIERSSEEVLELARAGDRAAAKKLARTDLIPRAENAGLTLLQAIDLNGERVRDDANEIERARRETARIAYGLDGVCVGLAALAGFIALRGIRRYTSLIEEQQRQLEIHNEELEMFAMRVAHDIRGPLTPVVMALEKGSRQAQDEGTRRMFEAAQRSVQRIRGLIEGLLLFAKAGAVPDPNVSVDAAAVLQGVIEDVLPEAEAAKISVRLESAPIMAPVRCTPAVLSSIASNLIRNAMKFMGDATRREIDCRIREVDGKALLEIVDTGPGISEELARRIFEPYVRAPDTKAPGIGLGLATVKRLAIAHGGQVGVESRPGEGARFWVELPLAKQAKP